MNDAGPVVLRADRLSRTVDGRAIVDGVSVDVHEGEVVAVVGPSGSGKSSLLRLMNRLDEPTGGTVVLDGQDYRALSPRELRRRVGMVMQTAWLFPGTVADNLRFGPRQHGEELSDDEVRELLRQVGLAGFEARAVDGLSGGERQRVSVARAVANGPRVLLLDEPTSALDERSKGEVEELLQGVVARRRLTAVMVTHDLRQAERLTRRVVMMTAGRVRYDGAWEGYGR